MKKLLLTVFLYSVFLPVFSQGWKKTYTNASGDPVYLYDVKALPAGGMVAVGSTGPVSNSNAVLMRCDDQGNVLWAKEYNSGLHDNASKVALYPGGGYVVLANQLDTSSLNDNNIIFRTDTAGNILWSYGFIGNGIHTVQEIEVTPTGKTIFTGNTSNCPVSFGCAYAAALNTSGTLLWAKSIEANFVTTLNDVIHSSDNQLVFAGAVLDSVTFLESGFAAKFDTSGTLTWANSYFGSPSSDRFYAVTENSDLLGYVMAGHTLLTTSGNYEAHLMTSNYSGNYQSSGFAGGVDGDEVNQVFTLSGTNVFIGGYSEAGTGLNIHAQGLNGQLDVGNGNINDVALLGVTTDDEYVQSAVAGAQGQILQALQKNPFSINGRIDFLLSKSITPGSVCNETPSTLTTNLSNYLDNFGATINAITFGTGGIPFSAAAVSLVSANGCVNIGIGEAAAGLRLHLYPNPAQDFLIIDGDILTGSTLTVHDAKGALVLQQTLPAGRSVIQVRDLPAGLFSATLSTTGTTATRYFIISR